MDNQITNMFVSLATDVEDPVERLQAINRSTTSAKAMTKALGARQIQSLGEVASPLILGTAIRAVYRTQLMSKSPVRVNTLVSNVPGPQVPLYMCGAKVAGIYPSSVILEGMGVNITVFSYLDRLDFGIHVDPDLVPDPWVIAERRHRGADRAHDGLGPRVAHVGRSRPSRRADRGAHVRQRRRPLAHGGRRHPAPHPEDR